jgi:RNA polymerase sigma factor (TIGR02999 family)
MRRILVDHAKAKRRGKRGGGAIHVPLEDALHAVNDTSTDLAAVDEALTRLAARDERKARVVELHFFAGLTYEEIAEVLAISPATVDRDLRFAKAWLFTELRDQEA